MKDSDPRPMPPEVQRAYRRPLELGRLFATDVFSPKDRLAVRRELIGRLVARHGNAEVESPFGFVSVPQRAAELERPWKGIDLLMSVPEYGGKDAVKLELAHVMQPYWSKWWDRFDWADWQSISRWKDTVAIVLGDRQLLWLSAQYARSVIWIADPESRDTLVAAFESIEDYSTSNSSGDLDRMLEMSREARMCAEVAEGVAAYDAAYSASWASSDAASEESAAHAAYSAAAAASNAVVANRYVAATSTQLAQLASLTKRLITPTLVTSASRGLR